GHRSRSVRADQPLLVLGAAGGIAPNPSVVQAQPRDFARVLPASAAMFEEELGFSPFAGGAAQYRDRVERLIHAGRVFIDPGPRDAGGPLRFKADIGLLSSRCAQIQGVWMAPAARGRGLAASAMAAVVDYVRLQAPVVSLYVNAYNTPALRTYERVGFERRGTFATVLY
ncbi:GNAT family N-acetyltransferase, partial [Micrococcus luteus]